MFEANVIATKRVTSALLPCCATGRRTPGIGDILTVTSIAGHVAYEGGGGYNAAKFAEHALVAVLRLELAGEPIRVIEVAPGMVETEEFSLNRFGGDRARADAVYAEVPEPLTAEDVAETIVHALQLPVAREPRPDHRQAGRAGRRLADRQGPAPRQALIAGRCARSWPPLSKAASEEDDPTRGAPSARPGVRAGARRAGGAGAHKMND